jgi:DNA-binding response OmpR family regulator
MRDVWQFGSFKLDAVDRRLSKNGKPVPLPPKAFDLLTILVKNGGKLVLRKTLLETVWGDAAVEDANLTNNVTASRSRRHACFRHPSRKSFGRASCRWREGPANQSSPLATRSGS